MNISLRRTPSFETRPTTYLTAAWVVAAGLCAPNATATTTLTVDLSSTLGPAKHVASGALYGVTESKPADVAGLIAPLRPNMFTNPATSGAGRQQPVGDAIAVAGRVASTGAKVTLRLADWLPGWPYQFSSMTDWFGKIDTTVAQKKAAGLTNIYAYEIWNEPDGTWAGSDPAATGTRPVSFNQLWLQTYQHLRQVDPGAKITGPSISYYNSNFIRSFLTFCKTNNCLPDIVGWHELSGGNVTSNVQNYRTMETQLGVGPLPITINEYSGPDHIDDEGQPGASAPLIAKFERLQVDSACITFWDVAHPGRLGSLLATDTAKNGGWWFYKWYGEMSGNMVMTTPPSPTNPSALDGFANLDTQGAKATVIFGGVNDGSVQIVVKGFQSATFFGTRVRATVEHTPFVSRTTVVNATNTISTTDVTVANNQIAVTVSGSNNNDGYRLSLTPIGGSSGGGASATGGASTTGGTRAAGGTSAFGGSRNTGGAAALGGTRATGGAQTTGGTSSTNANTGGVVTTTGGQTLTGGATNFAGNTARGSNSGVGGVAVGGQLSSGGANVLGGSLGVGGSIGNASNPSATQPDPGTNTDNTSENSGCGCRVARQRSNSETLAALGMFWLILLGVRRRNALNRERSNPVLNDDNSIHSIDSR